MNGLPTERENREWALDGLRGVAALVVVAEHYLKHFFPVATIDYAVVAPGGAWWEYLSLPPFNLFSNGAAAVSLFFVLSGYVLAMSAFRHGRDYQILPRLVGRYIRLAVPVTASLLLLYLSAASIGYDGPALMAATGSMERPAPIPNMTFQSVINTGLVGSMFFMHHSFNAPLWTITYEVIGSVLVMMFCWSSAKLALSATARGIAYLIAAALLFDTFLIGFVLGAAIADARRSGWAPAFTRSKAGIGIMLLAGLCALSFGFRGMHSSPYAVILPSEMPTIAKYTINAFGSAILLLITNHRPCGIDAASHKTKEIAIWLGALSFPIYLLHYPLISIVGSKVFFMTYTAIGMMGESSVVLLTRYWVSSSVAILLTFLVTLIAAGYFARFVDIPSISAARRINLTERALQ